MKAVEFMYLCEENLIAPEIALENEELRQALRDKDDEKIKEILQYGETGAKNHED